MRSRSILIAITLGIMLPIKAMAFPSILIEQGIDDNIVPLASMPFELVLGGALSIDPTTNSNPFSVNIGGTLYDSVYMNPNGAISFGSGFTDDPTTTPLSTITRPIIAPLFTNYTAVSRAAWGTGNSTGSSTTWLNYFGAENAAGLTADFQVGIQDAGGGDFNVIINYRDIAITDAQAGLTDGSNFYEFPGAGSYHGPDVAGCSAPRLSCYNTNVPPGTPHPTSTFPVQGRHIFSFRDGALVVPQAVPEPAMATLLLFGVFTLFATKTSSSRRRTNFAQAKHNN